jgi:hypothetical protein
VMVRAGWTLKVLEITLRAIREATSALDGR